MRASERRAAADFLREVYASADVGAFARTVTSRLSSVIPGDIAVYNEYDAATNRIEWVTEPAGADGGLRPLFEAHMQEHPIVRDYVTTGDGRARCISDFLTQRQFHDLGLYCEFYGPIRVEHQMAIQLAFQPIGIAVGLTRSSRFSESDRALFDLLRPHLAWAYRHAAALGALRSELAASREALDALRCGVVTLAPNGRPREMTPRAAELLGGRLPEPVRAWARRAAMLATPPPPLEIERGDDRVVIRMILAGEDRLLLVEDRSLGPALNQLGLTERESEVLARVAEGKSNPEIASLFGISGRTVDKHLEHVYAKLGVEGRDAASARALVAAGIR